MAIPTNNTQLGVVFQHEGRNWEVIAPPKLGQTWPYAPMLSRSAGGKVCTNRAGFFRSPSTGQARRRWEEEGQLWAKEVVTPPAPVYSQRTSNGCRGHIHSR